jgi:shikimate kinase
MKNKNIILIGMMGSGKTTVGRYLHKEIPEYFLIDLDHEIEKDQNQKISEIFDRQGEAFFRNLESQALKTILKQSSQIISSGGGIVLSEENRKLIDEKTFCVYLKASPEVIFDRIKHSKNRPLLNTADPLETIKTLLNQREGFYEACADLTIESSETNHLTPEAIALKIKAHL